MVAYHQITKVAKAPLLACLTCPLCDNLVEEATTISECLHTFCRDCIEQRFSTKTATVCPICEVYLGCSPMDKLRADPQLDDIRKKLFPLSASRKRKSSPLPPPRRKERSLSSLGLSVTSSVKRGRRPKAAAVVPRTVVPSSSSEDKDKDADGDGDGRAYKRRCRRTTTTNDVTKEVTENGKGKQVEQSPLEYLAEVADAKLNRQVSQVETSPQVETSVKVTTAPIRSGKYGKLSRPTRGVVRKPLVDMSMDQTRDGIWLALRPAEIHPEALPPISKPYLRINDASRVGVSTVLKYLIHKLDLVPEAESEIELTCCGQKVMSSLPLEAVKSLWLGQLHATEGDHPASSTTTGTSEQQQFMTLYYMRKTQDEQQQQRPI